MSALLAVWSFLMSPIGRLIGVGALCLVFGFSQGYRLKARMDRSATLAAIVAKQQIDLQAAAEAAEKAEAVAAELSESDTKNQEIIRGLQGNSCKLDDAGAGELRRIR